MRTVVRLNDGWIFTKEGIAEEVAVPHTWNAEDGQDGGNDYYRGTCSYKKRLEAPIVPENGAVYLEFRGVNSTAQVYVNGELAGRHEGGYSTFRVDITDQLKAENEIEVFADNAPNDEVYPQKADFTFYGGIYRDVYLIVVPEEHFGLENMGAPGLQVRSEIQGDSARVRFCAEVSGPAESVRFTVAGVGSVVCPVQGKTANGELEIPEVRLWNGRKDPYLYILTAELLKGGEVVDEISTRFGCREFGFDAEKGFILNGAPYPLHGVSRHQDRKCVGNTLTKEMHREDMELIAECGANSIRLAHYQHDQYFYDLCDEYGMIVWAEIPYITKHMPKGNENTRQQLRELILQNSNHPSVICWGLSNEITVSGMSEDLLENHRELVRIAHELDPDRPAVMAHAFMLDVHDPLLTVADINSFNLYYGWYLGELKENDEWFDHFHKEFPERIIGLSEYGADASPRWQSEKGERGDYSEQYQCLYHEHLLRMLSERPYIWSSYVWNMFDFGADGREEGGEKGVNQKGLVTMDRKVRKDAFYLYKAYWSEEPFVHICGKRRINRTEETTELKVYSNQRKLALYEEERLIEEKEGDKVFSFRVPLTGKHHFTVRAEEAEDTILIEKVKEQDASYILPNTGIHNWFDEPGMEFPEGRLSIREKLGTLREYPQAAAIVGELIRAAASKRGDVAKDLEGNETLQKMLNAMTLEALLKQAGESITKEMIVGINKKLNKIEK